MTWLAELTDFNTSARKTSSLQADSGTEESPFARQQRSNFYENQAWLGLSALLIATEPRDFIAAGQFSMADITAVVAVDFARVVKIRPGEQHPHLLRWRAAMALRPSMSL